MFPIDPVIRQKLIDLDGEKYNNLVDTVINMIGEDGALDAVNKCIERYCEELMTRSQITIVVCDKIILKTHNPRGIGVKQTEKQDNVHNIDFNLCKFLDLKHQIMIKFDYNDLLFILNDELVLFKAYSTAGRENVACNLGNGLYFYSKNRCNYNLLIHKDVIDEFVKSQHSTSNNPKW